MLSPADYRKTLYTQRRGTRADQPAANTVLEGTIYFVTDEGVLEQSDGASWNSYSSLGIYSSYTPVLTFGGASTGITYSVAFGEFIQIGNFVSIVIIITLTSKGSAVGNAEISLPFASISVGGGFCTALSGMDASVIAGIYGTMVTAGTTIILTTPVSTGNLVVDDTKFTNTSNLVFVGTFYAN